MSQKRSIVFYPLSGYAESSSTTTSKQRAIFGQNDGTRNAPDLFLWQEFLRLKRPPERKPSPVTLVKGWKFDCFLWAGKVCLCSHHFPSYCTQLQRALHSLTYLPTLLKDTAWRSAMARKQARGTALVSLNYLRSASWEAQEHQSHGPSTPGSSPGRRQRRALRMKLMELSQHREWVDST